MKIRIAGNSIRFRLQTIDLTELVEKGKIIHTLDFGNGNGLDFKIETCKNGDSRIEIVGTEVIATVPGLIVSEWKGIESFSYSHSQETDEGKNINFLIENELGCEHKGA
ncbi:MAG: DUF7009 family protein [Pyrinomonadaceae bacterium]